MKTYFNFYFLYNFVQYKLNVKNADQNVKSRYRKMHNSMARITTIIKS